MRLTAATALVLAALSAPAVLAQDAKPVTEKNTTPPAAVDALAPDSVAIPKHSTTDADVLGVLSLLTGSFLAQPAGDLPALRMNTAPMTVTGLDNALYFELSRDDSPQAAFRHAVLHVFKHQGKLTLRVLDFSKFQPGFTPSLTGLWAAPDALPVVALDQLSVNSEIVLSAADGGFSGAGTNPTTFGGATHMTSTVTLAKGQIGWADRGTDASGKQVWGPAAGVNSAFKAVEPFVRAQRRDGGLIVIDLVAGKADQPAAAEGSQVAVQYTGWVAADGFQFDTSRQQGREPFQVTLPAQLIAGWNQGLPGMRLGTVRRLYIPGPLGYGERGNPRARIPANATLIFDVECVFHKPAEPKPAEGGAGGAGGQGPADGGNPKRSDAADPKQPFQVAPSEAAKKD